MDQPRAKKEMVAAERTVGFAAVQRAARLTEAVRAGMVRGEGETKLDKEDRSPVTVADFGAQAIVCRLINDSFPGDRIVGEEDSRALREEANRAQLAAVTRFVCETLAEEVGEEAVCGWIDQGNGEPRGRYWVLDPIDGTKGFLRNDQYAIALALIDDGAIQWGFLACPALPHEEGTGLIYVAQRGAGATRYTLEGRALGPLSVSEVSDPTQARLTGSVVAAHSNPGLNDAVRARLGAGADFLRMDSQAKYAVVADGRADVYLRSPNRRTPDYRENIWDHAAGWLVVTEAGGSVTDIYGRPLNWSRGRRLDANIGVVATNGHLHEAVIDAIQAAMNE